MAVVVVVVVSISIFEFDSFKIHNSSWMMHNDGSNFIHSFDLRAVRGTGWNNGDGRRP